MFLFFCNAASVTGNGFDLAFASKISNEVRQFQAARPEGWTYKTVRDCTSKGLALQNK